MHDNFLKYIMKFNFNPKISVILPAYNCEKTIKRTLNSIIYQTYKPHEVIIVNDGSIDQTEQIIKNYKNLIPGLILINHSVNLGQGQARDTAINKSTGEYLAFIDSDDEWHQDKLSSCITFLVCTQTKLTFHDFLICSKNKNNFLIKGVIEKPSIKEAPSNKAVIGRYILPRKIFAKLLLQKPGKGGEIHITDSIQTLIKENQKFIAHNFSGKYLDCGSMNGYIKSGIEISKL